MLRDHYYLGQENTRNRSNSTSSWIILFFATTLIFFLGLTGIAEEHPAPKPVRILYINSYHPGYSWSDQIYQGIKNTLSDYFKERLDLRVEYLDGKRFSSELRCKLRDRIINLWEKKYLPGSLDLILVSDQDAYDLVNRSRTKLFPGVPMVFCGVESPAEPPPDSIGILNSADIGTNIDLIMKVLPRTGVIWIVTDNSTTGRIDRTLVEKYIRYNNDKVKINFFTSPGKERRSKIIDLAEKIKAPDVIFFLDYASAPEGPVDTLDFLRELTTKAKVPVFSHVNLYLDYGVTGGNMNSGILQGKQMAQIGTAILNGTPPQKIGNQQELSLPTFDFQKLKKFDIPLSHLPSNSCVINHPDSLWNTYGWYVVAIIIFLLAQGYLLIHLSSLLHQRKELKETSKVAEERFQSLFELAPIPMAYLRNGDLITGLNQQFTNVLGYNQSDMPTISDWWPLAYPDPKYRDEVKNTWTAAVASSIASEVNINSGEYRITCNNGVNRNMIVVTRVLNKQDLLICFFDITEQKKTETELKMANVLLTAQQEATIDGILLVDEQRNILSYNQRFFEVWGLKNENLRGCSDDNLLANAVAQTADPENFLKKVQYLYENKSLTSRDEIMLRDGRVLDRYSAPIVADNIYYGRIWFFRDITDRKKAEAERENLQLQLIHSQKMESVGRLAGGVAHDFNNMLGVIIGYTEMVMREIDPKLQIYAKLQEVDKAATRSAELTRQLLAFARKQTVNPQVLDLNHTVNGMLKMLRRLIGENIDIEWCPAACQTRIEMDPSQLDQILTNLCVNARDAIEGHGKITIETSNVTFSDPMDIARLDISPGQYVRLAVSDNGCGMDPATQERLFEPFFTTKQLGHGTGLGLATVYGIIKQNNGHINVNSQLGCGSTFNVFLPQYSGPEIESKEPHQPLPEGTANTGGNETILLVEDELMLLELSKEFLSEFGYRVLTADSPQKALKLAEQHHGDIDLLVTDVIMPGMNGKQLATQLTTRYPAIKLLFMSGYTANVIINQGVLDADANFLHKPFNSRDIIQKVREVLDK